MKETQRDSELEAWLDGCLDEDRARAFEARLETDPELAGKVELARRIDDALRRRFQLPEAPHGAAREAEGERVRTGAPAPRATDTVPVRRVHRIAPVRTWQVLAAVVAAAAVLLLLRPDGTLEPAPAERVDLGRLVSSIPGTEGTVEPDPGVCVGPLVETEPGVPLSRVTRPDLETLYGEATAWVADRGLSVCGPGTELSGALEASYGAEVELRPEAEGRLQGPFASSQWPTGLILAGYSDDAPAVLVAERQSTHECCLALQLPPDSDLKLFTWRVGGLLLTEITPHSEPRLLDYFGEAY